MHMHPMVRLAAYGFSGALVGILAGFLLGFLIRGLMMIVLAGQEATDPEFFQVIHFLSMGIGAATGGISGSVAALKK